MAGPMQPPAHTVTTQQVQQLQQRLQTLVAAVQQDQHTFQTILGQGNIVYRHQQRTSLTNLNARLNKLTSEVKALQDRGRAMRGAFTTETDYNRLRNDATAKETEQKSAHQAVTTQNSVSRTPTLSIGVSNLPFDGNGIVGQLRRWATGQGGAIAGTVFVLAPFGAHPVDQRWEIKNQALNLGPAGEDGRTRGNGSIPLTSHGERNLSAARDHLVKVCKDAGYI